MRNRLAAIVLLLACGAIPVRAGVIVLANRTARDVSFTAAGTAEQTIAPYEQAVLYANSGVDVSFANGTEKRTFRVESDAAYFFADLPDGITLQGIGAAGGHGAAPGSVPAAPGVLLKPPPLETIPVRVLVDEEEPARQVVWEARIRKRIAAASALLEPTCRVRFEVADVSTWYSDNKAADLPALLSDFERKAPRDQSRLTIGFTSQRTPEGTGTLHLGGTRLPLHSHVLVREWTPATEPGRLEVLLHELGHYLGAVHSPETTSVMRPKLGDGRSVSLRFPVGYDPLNTLAMNLVANEVRTRHVRSLSQLSPPTKERLGQIYREVQTAIPDDLTPAQFLSVLGRPAPKLAAAEKPAEPPAPEPRNELVEGARVIIAGIVKAAERNQSLPDRATPGTAPPFRRSGDALTEYYFREAAIVAGDLPPARAVPAYLVGLAISLDTSDLFRTNPVTGALWQHIESEEARGRRLKVLGIPTFFNRHDSCQHFVDSAALVVVSGPIAAEAAGVLKELLDSRAGGSGFSFADLASDLSGLAFARQLLANPDRLARLSESFKVADYALPPDGLVEGLTFDQFASQFGSVADKRFRQEQDKLRKRVRELPAYNPPAAPRALEKSPVDKPAPAKPPPEPETREKAAPEKKAVEKEPLRETISVPVLDPPSSPPSSASALEQHRSSPASSASRIPKAVLSLAGLGVVALVGSLYSIWPRRTAPGKAELIRAKLLFGTGLALAGLGLLGGAYARWSIAEDEPKEAPTFAASDLDPLWADPPLDPFAIPSLRAVRIPGFPGASAIRGATGRDSRGHIWFGVSTGGEAEPSARLMEYDPNSEEVTLRGDVLSELRRCGLFHAGERQATIRSRIVQATDGYLYFASTNEDESDSGSGRPEARGSHLWRMRPPDGQWEHLLAVPEGLVAAACGGPYVFALGYPDAVVYQIECATERVRSAHIGSGVGLFSDNLLADQRGHVYVPRLMPAPDSDGASLVELNRDLAEVAKTSLIPPGQAPRDDLRGLVAVQPLAGHSLAFVTGRGILYRIVPDEADRPAKVSALGAFHPRGDAEVVSLFSPDGARYLMGLAHRQAGRYEWLVFDLETGRPVVVPLANLEEDGRGMKNLLVSGSMTRDDGGRFYLSGSHRSGGLSGPVLFQVRLPR